MARITYLGCYADRSGAQQARLADAAASTKMDYICDALVSAGFDVELVSTATPAKKGRLPQLHPAAAEILRRGIRCHYGPALSFSSRLNGMLMRMWLCYYFLRNVRRSDRVLVYHSLWYAGLVRVLKAWLGFELILEVEEIYTIAFKLAPEKLLAEQKVIGCADKYTLCNDLMAGLLHLDTRKPHAVIYGQYAYCSREFRPLFDDGKTHVVYAGSIDRLRSAAFHAISAARFLSERYVMHILGSGADDVVAEMKERIGESNGASACQVRYEGVKSGDEYARFLCSCVIGLNTQTAKGDYMLYAFPSKLLVYLCHGLNVVTSRLDSLPASRIHPVLNYYESDDGESIARAIRSAVLLPKSQIREAVLSLNREFVGSLGDLLGGRPSSESKLYG